MHSLLHILKQFFFSVSFCLFLSLKNYNKTGVFHHDSTWGCHVLTNCLREKKIRALLSWPPHKKKAKEEEVTGTTTTREEYEENTNTKNQY